MTSAALDRLLAVLVIALAASGLVSLRMGAPGDAWLFVGHGLLGGALAIAVVWKAGRSMPRAIRSRAWRRVVLGAVVTLAAAAALVGGFAWVASGRLLTVGSWTVLTLHAWIGLALVPILAVHLLPRRWRLLVPGSARAERGAGSGRTRRQVLVMATLGVAAVAVYGMAQAAENLIGGVRRFTGSRWLAPGLPPPTTFYGEAGPAIDAAAWQLRVYGNVAREITLSLDGLRELGERDQTTVLDCTSGWAMAAAWRGVPLRAVLVAAGADPHPRSVVVRSATGWAASLGRTDLDGSLLATFVAGRPLPAANGAPCRLVVPNRRGLDWVKWVAEVEVV